MLKTLVIFGFLSMSSFAGPNAAVFCGENDLVMFDIARKEDLLTLHGKFKFMGQEVVFRNKEAGPHLATPKSVKYSPKAVTVTYETKDAEAITLVRKNVALGTAEEVVGKVLSVTYYNDADVMTNEQRTGKVLLRLVDTDVALYFDKCKYQGGSVSSWTRMWMLEE